MTTGRRSPSVAVIRLPVPWEAFGLPNPLRTRSTVLTTGDPAWRWHGAAPELGVPGCDPADGDEAAGWGLDHVVLLVADLDAAAAALAEVGLAPRLRIEVKGRPTAFYRAGPVLEIIESPVRGTAIFGVALVTEEPLEVVALRWQASGLAVAGPRPAIQPGRRILTVGALDAGVAVMSPDGAAPAGQTRR